jgi:hypothetical protein
MRDFENNAIKCQGPVVVRQHFETRVSPKGSHSVAVPIWQIFRDRIDGGVRILNSVSTERMALQFARGYAAALDIAIVQYDDEGNLLFDSRV